MTTKEITTLLNIPYTTFKEWNTVGHKKYELTLLLLGIDIDTARNIIKNENYIVKSTPKYSSNTKKARLNKEWFSNDLFWSTANKELLDINNIVTVYINRATQINTDKLCELFGYERVIDITSKYIDNDINKTEAKRQLEYYNSKINNSSFKLTHEELNNNYLIFPKQRVIDYYCNFKGCDTILEEASNVKPKYPRYAQIKQMVKYYKEELTNDNTIKR